MICIAKSGPVLAAQQEEIAGVRRKVRSFDSFLQVRNANEKQAAESLVVRKVANDPDVIRVTSCAAFQTADLVTVTRYCS